MKLECKNCCYYDMDQDSGHRRCFFSDWCDDEPSVAPCDRDDHDYDAMLDDSVF